MQLDTGLLLRALKGAPLSLLVALLHAERDQAGLIRATAYDRKTVQAGLQVLEDVGLATRSNYRCWAITAVGRSLVARLLDPEAGKIPVSASDNPVDNPVDNFGETAEAGKIPVSADGAQGMITAEAGKIPVSEDGAQGTITAEAGKIPVSASDDGPEAGKIPVSASRARKNTTAAATTNYSLSSSSSSGRGRARDAPDVANVAEQLQRLGIGVPMCDVLASLPHVTAEYARQHVAHGRDVGDSMSLIIHRIRSGDPVPVVKVRGEIPAELEDVVMR